MNQSLKRAIQFPYEKGLEAFPIAASKAQN